jgi:hypothetical protein
MPEWMQINAGGVLLALWILREVVGGIVIPLVKDKKEVSGDKDPEFWKAEVRKAVIDGIGPILTVQTEILREMNQNFKVLTKTATYVEEMFRHSLTNVR